MPSLTCFNYRFTPSWLMTGLTACVLLLFTYLGIWQIHRAQEKSVMLKAQEALALKKPKAWQPGQQFPVQYEKIKIEGTYIQQIFLLDNQHQEHQFGYDALTPMLLSDGSVIMVDRGWILGDSTRRTFQDLPIPDGILKIEGSVYIPDKNPWVLGEKFEEKDHNIIIIEALDTALISKILQKKVYPFIMRLDKQDAYGYVREWAVVSMPPHRHMAYALQWFVMALVIFIVFIVLNLKKQNEKKTK